MKAELQKVDGPLLLRPKLMSDSRGFFYESWNQKIFNELLLKNNQKPVEFIQDNHSKSIRGVLRGLHYQLEPNPQGKLVRCIYGKIFDVAVDIRQKSNTFKQWIGVTLSSENHSQLWIPKGFAHGFLTISETAEVVYKVTDSWNKKAERSLKWNDKDLNIDWPRLTSGKPLISEKDEQGALISQLSSNDLF
tara:strand:- start:734 stop:1306 length:573 start_codon:yes stop_codon:yes gene_type:complete